MTDFQEMVGVRLMEQNGMDTERPSIPFDDPKPLLFPSYDEVMNLLSDFLLNKESFEVTWIIPPYLGC